MINRFGLRSPDPKSLHHSHGSSKAEAVSVSPASAYAEVKKASPSTVHIRDPSFSYECSSVFEVQSSKLASPAYAASPFFAGTSLNSSQILCPQDVFPLAERANEPRDDEVLCSSDFGHIQEKQKPHQVHVAKRVVIGAMINSSIIHPPQFSDAEIRPVRHQSNHVALAHKPGRLKKNLDDLDDRQRGLSTPSFERAGSVSGYRKAQTPQNKTTIPRTTPKKAKNKGLFLNPFEMALNSAYLPTIKTPEQKRSTAAKKIAKGLINRRPKALTPDMKFQINLL